MTKQERKEYMADYNRHYYEVRKGRPTVCEMMEGITMTIPPTKINFNGSDLDEPVVCSTFGCSTHLTPEQQLYGTKCINCQSIKKIDPTSFISHPHKKSA